MAIQGDVWSFFTLCLMLTISSFTICRTELKFSAFKSKSETELSISGQEQNIIRRNNNGNIKNGDNYVTIIHGKQRKRVRNREEAYPDFLDPSVTILTSNKKPVDRFMPTIGNGHIATVVQSDTIYMNGAYSGYNVTSHRARIPSTCAISVSGVYSDEFSSTYSLDTGRGMYIEQHIPKRDSYTVGLKMYAHQELNRLLVTEISVNNTKNESILLDMTQNIGKDSTDINFTNITTADWRAFSGTTKESEYSGTPKVNVMQVSTHFPKTIHVPMGVHNYAFLTFVGSTEDFYSAKDYLDQALKYLFDGTLESRHTNAWIQRWREGRIDVEGNTDLARVNYASLYYLMSSLPVNNSRDEFYGLSPGGLAHGAENMDYEGHVFWDQETWMFPPILMIHADLGETILQSRMRHHKAATTYATIRGYKGAMFPWETAYSGLNVCPSSACATFEQHITGDIAFALKQYIMMTKDTDFLRNGGADLINDIATFWTSRVSYNSSKDMYEIYDVMPPDEYHVKVNNSVYTNTVAQISLSLPKYVLPLIGKPVPAQYGEIAKKMYIPFNEKEKWHPEFDNYKRGTVVKQADVVLLGFPLMQNLSIEVRKNDLTIYELVTPGGPAMTWGMFSLGWIELNDTLKAESLFKKQFHNINEPFKVWSEVPLGFGAVNFLTGIGGYLQSIIFGYGGFRIFQDRIEFNPILPPGTSHFNITGIDYLGGSLDFSFSKEEMSVNQTKVASDELKIVITSTGQAQTLDIGNPVVYTPTKASIMGV